VRVVCKVFHSGGHCETHGLDVPVDGIGAKGGQVMTKVRALGSGCTYARRYLSAMVFNIAVDRDDDANYAGARTRPTSPPRLGPAKGHPGAARQDPF
jgi:hypothetical protein